MENQRKSGTCAYCGEESNRLFEPPLIAMPDFVNDDAVSVWYHVPGQAYPGKELFSVVTVDGVRYMRPYETPDEPVCWLCFSGQVWPATHPLIVNLPVEFELDGYRKPVWRGGPTPAAPDRKSGGG